MKKKNFIIMLKLFALLFFFEFLPLSWSYSDVQIFVQGSQRCITSNGVPNHKIGQFPVKGNPHSFKEQKLKYCISLKPTINQLPNHKAKTIGITLTGIPIRPGSADWYE